MERFINILISATAGYYAQKALATKSDPLNIVTAVMVTAIINDILNKK